MRGFILVVLCYLLAMPVVAQDISACDGFDPPDASGFYYIGLGDTLVRRGLIAEAQTAYDCGIERSPDLPEAFVSRGFTHAAQLNISAALADYDRALELNPQLLAAYNNRGLLYSQDANYSLALADFTLLTTLDPTYVQAYHNRAMIHAAEGNFELAQADLELAIATDPDFAPSHSALGAVYLALAVESYSIAEELNGRPAQFDVSDTLPSVLDAAQAADPSVWFGLQMVDQVFEDAS